jgi:asparagine synthase (glutamine-hydrolysing)
MPGIVGLITKLPRQEAELRVRQMINCLAHEPFYSMGFWCDDELGVYVGWAEHESSFSVGMPVANETGNATLFFSGEEFPDPDRIRELARRGHDFEAGKSSYLVHLYEDDASFPLPLNGWFHGLVVDRAKERILLFNDRYGMHRLYYHQSNDAFYFAAEAKAILALLPDLREIDPDGLGEFIACGAVLENRTLFRGIEVLPQASAWTFSDGALKKRQSYFAPSDWEALGELDKETFYEDLHSVMKRNFPRYFLGNQRIGMSLTGGLDTRMVLACQKPTPNSLPCYTFGSMMREHQDVQIARQVAQMCSQSFQVLTAGQEFLTDFGNYAERVVYLSDGCADVSRAPDLYLNEEVRAIAPVRMTGNYGGEILRAVRIFKATLPPAGLYSPELISHVQAAGRRFEELPTRTANAVSFAAFQLVPWMLYGTLAVEKTQLTMRSPFLDNDFVRTCFRAPSSVLASNEVTLRLIADESKMLLDMPTDRGLAGNRGKVHSAVSRAWMQFLFKAEYAYDMGMPHWLARVDHTLMGLHFEKLFLGRHKPVHFRVWYRDALANYVRDVLLDERTLSRPHIERKGLEAMVRSHLKGSKNYTNEIHKALTVELVQRIFLDGKRTEQKYCEEPCFAQ